MTNIAPENAFIVTAEDRFIVRHFDGLDLLELKCTDCALQSCVPVEPATPQNQSKLKELAMDYVCLACANERIAGLPQDTFECQICLQDVVMGEIAVIEEAKSEISDRNSPYSQPCSHLFCRRCLQHYLQSKLRQDMTPNNLRPACPGSAQTGRCAKLMTLAQMKDLLPQQDYAKVKKLQLLAKTPAYTGEQVVLDRGHSYLVVCPDCVYGRRQTMLEDFKCRDCGIQRCVLCLSRSHATTQCLERHSTYADAKFEELIDLRRVQRCPHCKAPIEKNGGCSRIVCYSPFCKGEKAFVYAEPVPMDTTNL